jgi:hypothetical protein
MSAILKDSGHENGGDYSDDLDRNVAKVNVQIRVATGSNELAGDTDLTFKYCTFIDWQQSHHCGHTLLNY